MKFISIVNVSAIDNPNKKAIDLYAHIEPLIEFIHVQK